MWKNSRRFFMLLLAFLLLFSVSLSAEVKLTDQEYESIMTALDEAENTLAMQSMQIMELETRLTAAAEYLEISNRAIAALKMELDLQKTFLERQKSEIIKGNFKYFLIGFINGNISGAAWGIPLGVEINQRFGY